MITNNKFLEVLSSPNARITLILIILGVLGSAGVIIDTNNDGVVDQLDAANIVTHTFGVNLTSLLSYIVPILLGIVTKIAEAIKLKAFTWSYFKTPNFITLAFSLITLIIGAYFSMNIAALITVVIANIINFIYHINLPIKYGTDDSSK